MATRTVSIALIEQTPRARKVRFIPDLASLGDDTLLLNKDYSVTTDALGVATINLPVKASGSIRYRYEIPNINGISHGYFYLSAGAAVNLEDLIVAGATGITNTLQDYVDAAIAGITGPVMGSVLLGGQEGSILFIDSGGFAQDNFGLFYDNTNNCLKLVDKDYAPTLGFAGTKPYFTLGNATTIDNFVNFLGESHDLLLNQLGDGKLICGELHKMSVGGSYTNALLIGMELAVDNLLSTGGNGSLQGLAVLANCERTATNVYGATITAEAGGSGASGIVNLIGLIGAVVAGHNGHQDNATALQALFTTPAGGLAASVTLARGLWVQALNRDLNTLSELRGISIDSWVNTAAGVVTKSYGIYADASIDVGVSEKWFMYSLSTSPSLLSGPLSVPDDAYSPTGWDGNLQVPTKNAVRDLVEVSPVASLDYTRKVVHFHDMEEQSGFAYSGFVVVQSAAGMTNLTPPTWSNYPATTGVIILTLRTLATNNIGISERSIVNPTLAEFGILGQGAVNFKSRFGFIALSDGTNTYTVRCGVSNGHIVAPTKGCFFRYTHSVNGGRWEAVCTDGVETAVDTGVTVAVGVGSAGALHTFEVRVNAAGTSATFFIDGSLVATITTHIPTGSANLVGNMFQMIRSAGTTTVDIMALDYIRGEWNFTTPRP
ncbi:MAG: hypothetical protein ABI878_14830 [Acidobacteriota bacterium]